MGGTLDCISKVLFQISGPFTSLFMIFLSSSFTSPLHLKCQQSIWYEVKSAATHIISDSLYANSNTDDNDYNNNNLTLYSVIILKTFKEQAVNKRHISKL
jgi:hypothetical protein